MKKILTFIILLFSFQAFAQQSLLQSGPMLAYSEMREVALWVQTKSTSDVKIAYWPATQVEDIRWTNIATTCKSNAFVAKLYADQIEPGIEYEYDVYINNQKLSFDYPTKFFSQEIWRWRADAPDFKMVTGSCAYINEPRFDRPGTPYGSDYHIFSTIFKHQPDLMLWLGDNVYLREPDWNSKTGIDKRYTHSRSLAELQPLLASTHHYAIWDDHDYGPNNSDRGFWNKKTTFETFRNFWINPSYGVGDIPGAFTSFQYSDADFFLLDNRYYRSPDFLKTPNKTILGEEQLQWLKDALVSSIATFKVIAMGGQFLTSVENHETYSNYGFKEERDEIIKFIHDHEIKNVVFLSGDRHFTEFSILESEGNPTIYDLTTSSFTAGSNTWGDKEDNTYRQEGTLVMEHNFSILNFKGKAKDRHIQISVYNAEGALMWERKILNEIQ